MKSNLVSGFGRQPTADGRQPTADGRQPTADGRQPTADSRLAVLLLGFVAATALLAGQQQPANPLYRELVDQGLSIPEARVVKLPPPLIQDGTAPAARQAALNQAAGRLPLSLFLKNSPFAPFTLKIESIFDAKKIRRGQTMDLYFVAFGKLDTIIKKDILNQLLPGERKQGNNAAGKVNVLTQEQLKKRGLKLLAGPNLEERLAQLDITFLDKVMVNGITRNVKTTTPRSIITATRLDDRFADDKEFPNRWRSINRIGNQEKLGPQQPYSGMAGYVSVIELAEPAGALFIEMHYVFPEPPAWFGGLNLLRSKLPIVIQKNVRSFRQKLIQR